MCWTVFFKVVPNTLCCGIPNALRRNNPYNDLQSAEYYKTILKQIKDEWKSEWFDDEHVKDGEEIRLDDNQRR